MSNAHKYYTRSKRNQELEESKENESSSDDDMMDTATINDEQNYSHNHNHNVKRTELALKAFECPVCLELPPNVILQCPNGHLICDGCFQRIIKEDNRCAICRVLFVGRMRCLIAEQVLGLREMKCKNKGCKEKILFSELQKHLKLCQFRKTKCKFELLGCEWSGCIKNQSKHQIRCKYAKTNIDEFLNILRKTKEEKMKYQMLGKYEQIRDVKFNVITNQNQLYRHAALYGIDYDSISRCFQATLEIFDDHQASNLMVQVLMFLIKSSTNRKCHDLKFMLRFQSACNCGSNHFNDEDVNIILGFCIVDGHNELGLQSSIPFEPICDSRERYFAELRNLNQENSKILGIIDRRTNISLKIFHSHSEHNYVDVLQH